jgi:hypothetical protein
MSKVFLELKRNMLYNVCVGESDAINENVEIDNTKGQNGVALDNRGASTVSWFLDEQGRT